MPWRTDKTLDGRYTSGMKRSHLLPLVRCLACCTGLALGGCSALLPTSRTEVVSRWLSYEDGLRALATLTPYVATRQDVHLQGLDPHVNPGITVLHFADVLQRFSAAALIRPQDVDPGISDCLGAGQRCSAYAVVVQKIERQRVGNFWVDSLNFRRQTVSRGWRVEALLVFVDDRLVYELVGGQPTIYSEEEQRNPLGPLQGWGSESWRALR